jgi:hypothetical protein
LFSSLSDVYATLQRRWKKSFSLAASLAAIQIRTQPAIMWFQFTPKCLALLLSFSTAISLFELSNQLISLVFWQGFSFEVLFLTTWNHLHCSDSVQRYAY